LCNLLKKEKLDIKLDCQTRCDLVDKNLLEKMKEAGCIDIKFGIETFSQSLQYKIKKI